MSTFELRITVEEVKAAYKKTGIQPIQIFYCGEDSKSSNCGCPVTALYCVAKNKEISRINNSVEIEKWADEVYGMAYHHAFVRGVDRATNGGVTERHDQGYADGCEVAKAIFGEAA